MKIKVPEFMLVSFRDAMQEHFGSVPGGFVVGLEAALEALAENPIVPTNEQISEMSCAVTDKPCPWGHTKPLIIEWQRRMFEAPEPEVPEAIRDLLDPLDRENRFLANQHILEAYRRGQQSKEKANAK